jgi:hypothetical protein
MPSSGMLRRVALARSEVSEETSASIFTVRRIIEIVTTLAVTSNRGKLPRNTDTVDTVDKTFVTKVVGNCRLVVLSLQEHKLLQHLTTLFLIISFSRGFKTTSTSKLRDL